VSGETRAILAALAALALLEETTMTDKVIRAALLGYGMFGADVVVGTIWDLMRNGIAPYLDRIGLDDFAAGYVDVRFDLVAVGTRSEASARRAEAETETATGRRPQGYAGDAPWEAIFRDHADLDVVFVATPDHLHTAPIMTALAHGCHVLTEKPMCLDLTEADAIIATAERAGLIVGADMHKRYDPDHLKIFGELAGDLGTPIYARGVLEEPLEVSTQTFKWVEQSDPSVTSASTGSTCSCTTSSCAPSRSSPSGRSSVCVTSSARTPSTPCR
jgi:predicted dehydrogenase